MKATTLTITRLDRRLIHLVVLLSAMALYVSLTSALFAQAKSGSLQTRPYAVGEIGVSGATSESSEILYQGSLTLDPTERSTVFSYKTRTPDPRSGSASLSSGGSLDARLVVEGYIDGYTSRLTALPMPSEYPGHQFTERVTNDNYRRSRQPTLFRADFHMTGLSRGVALRNEGGATLVIQRVTRWPGESGQPPVEAYDTEPLIGLVPPNSPGGVYPPTYPPNYPTNPIYPPSAGYQPPYALQPIQPVQPQPLVVAPVPAVSNRIVLYRGDHKVKENDRSRQFLIPSGRRVRSIDILWSDKDHKATGYLLLDDEARPSLPGREVNSPNRVRWTPRKDFDSFRVLARGDHIWVKEVAVTFDEITYYTPPMYGPDGDPVDPGYRPPGYARPSNPNSQVFEGPFNVQRSGYSRTLHLYPQRKVTRVVIQWTDFRENAIGYVAFDNEPWTARRGATVDSPGSATFQIGGVKAKKMRIYARNDDIQVSHVKVYYGK